MVFFGGVPLSQWSQHIGWKRKEIRGDEGEELDERQQETRIKGIQVPRWC